MQRFRSSSSVSLSESVGVTPRTTQLGVTPCTTQLGMTPCTPIFEEKKRENQKTLITIRKGRLLLVNDQGFSQIALTYFSKIPPKKSTFLTLVKFGWSQSPVFVQFIITLFLMNILIWNLLCSYLAITFHYDVLKRFFDSIIRVVVVGVRSRLAFFRNRGWLVALFSLFFIKYFEMNSVGRGD